jgi:hypothetical protein
MKRLDGNQIRKNEFLYDIEETCPWCLTDIGAEALIVGTPHIHSNTTWMAVPQGLEITLHDETGERIAFHSHVCESPWLP